MGKVFEQIVTASRRGRGLADKMLVGVTPQIFARKPRFETTAGTKVIDCNHPAFVFGHLSLYPARIYSLLGLDGTSVAAPAEYTDLFKAGAECKDDPEGRLYPAMDKVVGVFGRNYDTALDRLATLDDALLFTPTPDERYRQFFPMSGIAVNFMLTSHLMMHMGQISTWRRCFGLPSAM
ncbi:MAG: DinB family protein [Planctomycetes bacterium]|nr:DinB family protein [Planctomycetota bacterium]